MPRSADNKNSFSYQNPLKGTLGAAFFKSLPQTPGVYFMLGADGRILYIGKAKSLKARLSTYSQLKPGKAEERILELIEQVRKIRWENHPTEAKALARESELLRVLRPPFNVAGTDEEIYLYIGIRKPATARPQLEFRLSNEPDFGEDGYEIFGGYRNRGKVKRGYVALLRLIHAYQCASPRFSYPARISRVAPPWQYRTRFPQELDRPLRDFLSGRNRKLLTRIFDGLLENENLPAFMRPSIQDDIDIVKVLYKAGPRVTRELRRKHGHSEKLVAPEEMNRMIVRDVVNLPEFE